MTTAYATIANLLERTNVLRLVQLAVPTAGVMPAVDVAQAALLGKDTSDADAQTQEVLDKTVAVVQTALEDAADLMRSYGLPEPKAPVPPVLVRMNCQLAMHYLLEHAGMLSDADTASYNAQLKLLDKYSRGEVGLVPVDASVPPVPSDVAVIESGRPRYGRVADDADEGAWL